MRGLNSPTQGRLNYVSTFLSQDYFGIALFPQDSDDPESLVRYADIAPYQAKTQDCGYWITTPSLTCRTAAIATASSSMSQPRPSGTLGQNLALCAPIHNPRFTSHGSLSRYRVRYPFKEALDVSPWSIEALFI